MKNAIAFVPDKVEVVDILLIAVIKPDLVIAAIVLQLPVRRRRDDKMNALILQLTHPPAIADDYGGFRVHCGLFLMRCLTLQIAFP